MAIRNLRFADDELLRKNSRPVKEISNSIKTLLDDMIDTMYSLEGVGLAAPQVGVLRRVVIIDIGKENPKLIELINPEITESRGTQYKTEGCLSIPGETGIVERPSYVKVKALNRDGEEITIEGHDILAVALCHELDHLDGVLYTDKLSDYEFDDDDGYDDDDDYKVAK